MLRMEGDKQFSQPSSNVWSKLTDLKFLVHCIPDVAETKEVNERAASVVLRPGFSFIRGELQLTLEKQEETPITAASFLARTKGIGTNSEVQAGFTLTDGDGGTKMHWTADIQQLGGLLKAVPQGLIKAAAQKVIGDLMASIEKVLTDESATPA